MKTEIFDTTAIFAETDEAVSEMTELTSSLEENKINKVPFRDSWTVGQLLRHITRSTNAMTKAILTGSKPANRDPGDKIPMLKKSFLDFSTKMKSPDFIVPEEGPYEKKAAIEDLKRSFMELKENTINTRLTDLAENLPIGSITKWEVLHFVLYHTQRHLHQLKKIVDSLRIHN